MLGIKQIVIRDASDLVKHVGKDFVILAGSAVSGRSAPYVPMVTDFETELLLAIAEQLDNGSYQDQLSAAYARALVQGKYERILNTTKFEEFLWRIERALGRHQLDDLLLAVYACGNDEFGPNQSAIASLLEEGICSAVLTTNFDNSIEVSASRLGLVLDVYFCKSGPATLKPTIAGPVLIKLHGDAKQRNCTATNPELAEGLASHGYDHITDLLRNRIILVAGYSGFGDVDIAPHLEKSGAEFLWMSHRIKEPIPEYAKALVLSDLSSNDPRKNLLLGLSQHLRCKTFHSIKRDWQTPLRRWSERQGTGALRELVMGVYDDQYGWPVLHMMHVMRSSGFSQRHFFMKTKACLGVAAYGSALDLLQNDCDLSALDLHGMIQYVNDLGFTQWRFGDLEGALRTLSRLLSDLIPLARSEDDERMISEGVRFYLETCRDGMRYCRRGKSREEFYQNWSVDVVIEYSKRLQTFGPKAELLAEASIIDLGYLLKGNTSIDRLLELYDQSFKYNLWYVAEFVARILLIVRPSKGIKPLLGVEKIILKRRNLNILRKSIATLLFTFLKTPIILKVIDGPIGMRFKTTFFVERRLARKRKLWDKMIGRYIAQAL